MPSRNCIGVVLAGGANTRFGGALKGLLPLGGKRIVDRVLAALAQAADELIVIAGDPAVREALPGIPVHADTRRERGSLVGLHSGVSRATDGALVVAWDMPFVTSALLLELRRLGEAHEAAIIPEGPRGPEPLCAYYPRACAEAMERQLAAGSLRLGALIDALPSRRVLPRADVKRFGMPARLFANINSPGDLEAARRSLRRPRRRTGKS
jgi:molybdopterin-guanine dinucleotide biosynthesis protein A